MNKIIFLSTIEPLPTRRRTMSGQGCQKNFSLDEMEGYPRKRGFTAALRANNSETPAPASPEFSSRPRRRTSTAKDKPRILGLTDQAAGTGEIGAILRREGIYSSTLCDWRRQRDARAFDARTPVKRGPKAAETNPLAAGAALLQRSNAGLARRLARAGTIIDVQKKVAALLGLTPDGGVP